MSALFAQFVKKEENKKYGPCQAQQDRNTLHLSGSPGKPLATSHKTGPLKQSAASHTDWLA